MSDKRRTQKLELVGFRVLRFTSQQVFEELENVRATIMRRIEIIVN